MSWLTRNRLGEPNLFVTLDGWVRFYSYSRSCWRWQKIRRRSLIRSIGTWAARHAVAIRGDSPAHGVGIDGKREGLVSDGEVLARGRHLSGDCHRGTLHRLVRRYPMDDAYDRATSMTRRG
jgi:hypothetical protein